MVPMTSGNIFFSQQKHSTRPVLPKKELLEILSNSKENICASVFFKLKLQALRPAILLKRDSAIDIFL